MRLVGNSTITGVGATDGWAITDEVVRLRVWGTDRTFALADPDLDELVIGKVAGSAIRLEDPAGMVSKQHALLRRQGSTWTLRDLGSKNGCFRDGERRLEFDLAPGVEIEIGGVKLIAESAELARFAALLHRVLGFDGSRRPVVDAAMRSVRDAAALRTALVLRGEGDLAPVARRLHEHAVGRARALLVCKGGDDGIAALHAAAHGTLCLFADALPILWQNVVTSWREQSFKARLTVCTSPGEITDDMIAALRTATAIDIPPLARRQYELERIVTEYARDAVAELGATDLNFKPRDWDWVHEYVWPDLAEIEDATRKLVALRNWSVTAGAAKLGISHVALGRWARRRKLPT